mgnify:CR=1 FL=1
MTKVVRWTPMNSVNLMNEFDRLFERPYARTAAHDWNIALDVAENDDAYLVTATVPAINPVSLQITLENPLLPFPPSLPPPASIPPSPSHLRERRFGSFNRSIRFPVAVNGDAVEANYNNGILSLNIPKAEAVKPKRISINPN